MPRQLVIEGLAWQAQPAQGLCRVAMGKPQRLSDQFGLIIRDQVGQTRCLAALLRRVKG